MNREDQKRAPIYEALEKFRKHRRVEREAGRHNDAAGHPHLHHEGRRRPAGH